MILTGITRALFWDDEIPWDGAVAEGLMRLQPGEDYAHERTEIGERIASNIIDRTIDELYASSVIAYRIFRLLPVSGLPLEKESDARIICDGLQQLVAIGVMMDPGVPLVPDSVRKYFDSGPVRCLVRTHLGQEVMQRILDHEKIHGKEPWT